MADRWRGLLGRVDDGVDPGQGYRDFLSCFGIPVSGFPLTYLDELIDEVSDVGRKGARARGEGERHGMPHIWHGVIASYHTA